MVVPVFVGVIILVVVVTAGTIGSTILSFKYMAKNPNALFWAGKRGMYCRRWYF